jgi:hypothetical protein
MSVAAEHIKHKLSANSSRHYIVGTIVPIRKDEIEAFNSSGGNF